MESALAVERELQQRLFASEDAKEGLAAYVEKRPATFKAKYRAVARDPMSDIAMAEAILLRLRPDCSVLINDLRASDQRSLACARDFRKS